MRTLRITVRTPPPDTVAVYAECKFYDNVTFNAFVEALQTGRFDLDEISTTEQTRRLDDVHTEQ